MLGAHAPTDAAFAQALRAGAVDWEPEIRAAYGLFERKGIKSEKKLKKVL